MDEREKQKWRESADKQTYRDLLSIDKRIADNMFINNNKDSSKDKNIVIIQSLVRRYLAKKIYNSLLYDHFIKESEKQDEITKKQVLECEMLLKIKQLEEEREIHRLLAEEELKEKNRKARLIQNRWKTYKLHKLWKNMKLKEYLLNRSNQPVDEDDLFPNFPPPPVPLSIGIDKEIPLPVVNNDIKVSDDLISFLSTQNYNLNNSLNIYNVSSSIFDVYCESKNEKELEIMKNDLDVLINKSNDFLIKSFEIKENLEDEYDNLNNFILNNK